MQNADFNPQSFVEIIKSAFFPNFEQMSSNCVENDVKNFYFFIENEFVCRRSVDLCQIYEGQHSYTLYAITINLVNFSSIDQTQKVTKIFSSFSDYGFDEYKMQDCYKNAEEFIKSNFIGNDGNKIFLGCVRDDSDSHQLCKRDELGFDHRTDPIHDIFNILKNIYTSKGLTFADKELSLNDLQIFLDSLKFTKPELHAQLPNVGYFNLYSNNINHFENINRIWIPNSKSAQLEKFMAPLRYLFSINYYERLMDEAKIVGNEGSTCFLDFILIMKGILNFIETSFINDETLPIYIGYLEYLNNFNFQNPNIRCLNSLKETMQINIKFFEDHKVPFKPIWFSTQMIEAEKGHLRYEARNDLPTENQCKDWFYRTMCEGVDVTASSEFGKCHLKFDPLPEGASI